MFSEFAILSDPEASARARGVYFTLLALKETKRKKLTKRDIEESIPGGRDLFANAWKELKELGYIRLHATACPHGWIYEIEPVMNPNPDSPHTIYYNSSGIITKMIFRDGREIRGNGF